MNWDKPVDKDLYVKALIKMGHYGDQFKERHTGESNLTWYEFGKIHPELNSLTNKLVDDNNEDENYQEYLDFCRVRNSKLYRALK